MKAAGVPVAEHVPACAVDNGEASAAQRPDVAGCAGPGTVAVPDGPGGVVDVRQAGAVDVADGGGKLAAGMRLAVGQQRHEIERRAASVSGAAAGQGAALLVVEQIEQVVLEGHDGVAGRRPPVVRQKGPVALRQDGVQIRAASHVGKPVEGEQIRPTLQMIGKGNDLIHVVPGQRQHDDAMDAEFTEHGQKPHRLLVVPLSPDRVVVGLEPLQADLEKHGFPHGQHRLDAAHWRGISQNGGQKPAPGGLRIEPVEVGMHQGIAPGKGDLAEHVVRPAKIVQVVQHAQPPFQRHLFAIRTVIAVFAIQIAGLGDVPLEGEGRGEEDIVVGDASPGEVVRSPDSGRRREDDAPLNRQMNRVVQESDGNAEGLGQPPGVQPLHHDLERQQVPSVGGRLSRCPRHAPPARCNRPC